MSLPIGMYRRAFSYDDALEDPTPMTPPPSDMGSVPWKPVIPERKYQHLAKVSDPAKCPGRPNLFPLLLCSWSCRWLPAPSERGSHSSLWGWWASSCIIQN